MRSDAGHGSDRAHALGGDAAGSPPSADGRVIHADSARQAGHSTAGRDGFINHGAIVGMSNRAGSSSLIGRTNTQAEALCLDADMSPGPIIRELRKARGLSQAALAAAIGWERGTIAAIEAGHDRPGAELVEALATFFQVTTDHILGRQGVIQPAAAQNEEEAELLSRFRDATPEAQAAILLALRAMTKGRQ